MASVLEEIWVYKTISYFIEFHLKGLIVESQSFYAKNSTACRLLSADDNQYFILETFLSPPSHHCPTPFSSSEGSVIEEKECRFCTADSGLEFAILGKLLALRLHFHLSDMMIGISTSRIAVIVKIEWNDAFNNLLHE